MYHRKAFKPNRMKPFKNTHPGFQQELPKGIVVAFAEPLSEKLYLYYTIRF